MSSFFRVAHFTFHAVSPIPRLSSSRPPPPPMPSPFVRSSRQRTRAGHPVCHCRGLHRSHALAPQGDGLRHEGEAICGHCCSRNTRGPSWCTPTHALLAPAVHADAAACRQFAVVGVCRTADTRTQRGWYADTCCTSVHIVTRAHAHTHHATTHHSTLNRLQSTSSPRCTSHPRD